MKELSAAWRVLIGQFGLAGIGVSILILLWYFLRVKFLNSQVKKYAYVGEFEIKYFKSVSIIFSVSIFLFLFDLLASVMGSVESYEYFFVGFVSASVALMIGISLAQYFKVYYPFILERKLAKIRFQPRKSATSGKPMTLLNELEEDAHLTQKMIDQEDAYTYDYDVWIDTDSGEKVIERYNGHLKALICPTCHFRTMKDYKEIVIQSPSLSEKGILAKYFKCSNCLHEEVHRVTIASLKDELDIGTK